MPLYQANQGQRGANQLVSSIQFAVPQARHNRRRLGLYFEEVACSLILRVDQALQTIDGCGGGLAVSLPLILGGHFFKVSDGLVALHPQCGASEQQSTMEFDPKRGHLIGRSNVPALHPFSCLLKRLG